MIAIIGHQDHYIGFSLAGSSLAVELAKTASVDEILRAVEQVKEAQVIFISESFYKQVEQKQLVRKLFCVAIPEHFDDSSLERIKALSKEALGVELKE